MRCFGTDCMPGSAKSGFRRRLSSSPALRWSGTGWTLWAAAGLRGRLAWGRGSTLMCRLFGLAAGGQRVKATFWLLEAPDSLALQSRREPDGTGLGWFGDDRAPRVEKEPIAAYADEEFARLAREVASRTFVAHVRFASTGGLRPENTHPFVQQG